ncbi:unnamed protein product [Symbiodinium microadriaticum]|nr:unnamed protein product [Symbiodinium microadriaticum]
MLMMMNSGQGNWMQGQALPVQIPGQLTPQMIMPMMGQMTPGQTTPLGQTPGLMTPALPTEGARSKASGPPPPAKAQTPTPAPTPPERSAAVSGPQRAAPPLPAQRPKVPAMVLLNVPAEKPTHRLVKDVAEVDALLLKDWAWFQQLAGDSRPVFPAVPLAGAAYGRRDVLKNKASDIQVLFVPADVGAIGEAVAKVVANMGGRSHLVGDWHDLGPEMSQWGLVAILKDADPFLERPSLEKRARQEAAPLEAAAPNSPTEVASPGDLPGRLAKKRKVDKDAYAEWCREVKHLGTAECFRSDAEIPKFAKRVSERWLGVFGPEVIFGTLAKCFCKRKCSWWHRLALTYVLHELIMNKMIPQEHRRVCLGWWMKPIGKIIRCMGWKEREPYCELFDFWSNAFEEPLLTESELKEIQESWDV